MTESSFSETDAPSASAEHASLRPAPMLRRLIAYVMDFILLFLLLQLLAHFLPSFWDAHSKEEFSQLLLQASMLPKEDQINSEEMARFIDQADLSPETYEMLFAMAAWACLLPILYFFLSERFFAGQTLGKATFGLRSVSMIDSNDPPSVLRLFLRSTCKGLSSLVLITPFLLPGLLNFLFCFLNRKRRCLHDLLGGTITIQALQQGDSSA